MALAQQSPMPRSLCSGKDSTTHFDTDCPIFKDIPATSKVARYHSLAALENTLPDTLKVVAKTDDGEVMAVKHISFPIYGVQFHPESIMTTCGKEMLRNFIGEKL